MLGALQRAILFLSNPRALPYMERQHQSWEHPEFFSVFPYSCDVSGVAPGPSASSKQGPSQPVGSECSLQGNILRWIWYSSVLGQEIIPLAREI